MTETDIVTGRLEPVGWGAVDRWGPRVGIQIIGAGLSRTGTTSFTHAVELPGYQPCYQMQDVVGLDSGPNAGHLDAWHRLATAGEPFDWGQLFARYEAVVNMAGSFFYNELLQAFPDAKVVLTVRDPKQWVGSFQSLHAFNMELRTKDAMTSPTFSKWHTIVDRFVWDRIGRLRR